MIDDYKNVQTYAARLVLVNDEYYYKIAKTVTSYSEFMAALAGMDDINNLFFEPRIDTKQMDEIWETI